ncbi:rhomboid family intramembrane serine protease [Roseofilum reptotaenium CS-1145]|uniref:Rhomboid family intramembrane serine protease n=1 Tax=Roseofilum reptotaenium AO1-A TaxID=1925591 RepID=A0A1L9QRP8_9CYAN|nr:MULTISPECIES: rhomboid family intramembrane serine protease [Roseofilum]MBP0030278.1 rhomboid family intramembrane serine protease [Roseofilum sp. Guam]MDB9515426.1 rhomboid family intramembrane serine protease [Roseofilum reptotaenium CS-1145]OJJ25306.1 rhomboid family intramembrane serine protease [Roseofilum reptotaenium AO1-A]
MSSQEGKAIVNEFKTQIFILGGFVTLFWVVEIVDLLFYSGGLDQYGILPRNIIGLRGILWSPFLHGNLPHLIANTAPFLMLGWLVMLQETSDFFWVTAITMLVAGSGVWLFGSPAFHIGASSLIFGYLGFLLFRGLFERNFSSIFLSLVVGFFYGGLIWGVLPGQPGISWEGHLFGLIGGVLAARFLAKRKHSTSHGNR